MLSGSSGRNRCGPVVLWHQAAGSGARVSNNGSPGKLPYLQQCLLSVVEWAEDAWPVTDGLVAEGGSAEYCLPRRVDMTLAEDHTGPVQLLAPQTQAYNVMWMATSTPYASKTLRSATKSPRLPEEQEY